MNLNPNVICVIMGGGRGSRLYPLTKDRCKPAVPLGGKYRLVDIPISNCLNSGYNKIFLLTQFRTASLHRHIIESYKFDNFGGGRVDIMSAEQTEKSEKWYQGTADAVRQNMMHFGRLRDDDLFLILSGDQLYRMDFRRIIEQHLRERADITIAAKPIPSTEVEGLGVMRVLDNFTIAEFVEKPTDPAVIRKLAMSENLRSQMRAPQPGTDYCLASMGIYVFRASVLKEALAGTETDFGKEIIPRMLGKRALLSYIFDDYWEDIGTVRAFFEANLLLTDPAPLFDFANEARIFTRPRQLPPTRVDMCDIERAIIAEACVISEASIKRCLIGVRSNIGKRTRLENVVMMGADYRQTPAEVQKAISRNEPPVGIGCDCHIQNAIIDKNARIGDNVQLSPEGKPDGYERDGCYVRDGVLVVLKDAIVPHGTLIGPGTP